jgi:NADH:ubiquinone oxidoreductase subunit C
MTVGWLPGPAEELFGPDAVAEESYEVLTVDVPPASWIEALSTARDVLGCTYFDWLSAVDEPGTGFLVSAHVAALSPVRRLLVRTTVPHAAPVLPSAVSVYAGAAWHERETHEMFGVTFEGHPGLDTLLLPDGFEGHPLRKDFVLAARVAKAWPGAKEPGESEHGGPKRRQMLPPGVPDPNEWGPLKGRLPPAPSRPARGAARPAGDRPVRRARTAAEGSVGQTPTAPADAGTPAEAVTADAAGAGAASAVAGAGAGAEASRPARRARSASQGSASQRAEQTTPSEPAAAAEPVAPSEATPPTGSPRADEPDRASRPVRRPAAARSSDAPWHQAKPAFEDPEPKTEQGPKPEAGPTPTSEANPEPDSGSTSEPDSGPVPESRPEATSEPDSVSVSQPRPEAMPEPEPGREPKAKPGADAESGAAESASGESADRESTDRESTDGGSPAPGSPPTPDEPDDPSGGKQ